jgi:hypothetical protein
METITTNTKRFLVKPGSRYAFVAKGTAATSVGIGWSNNNDSLSAGFVLADGTSTETLDLTVTDTVGFEILAPTEFIYIQTAGEVAISLVEIPT